MKILISEPGQELQTAADYLNKRRQLVARFNILEYWWVAAAAVFALLTVFNGGVPGNTSNTSSSSAAPVITPTDIIPGDEWGGFCSNPHGGLIAPGDVAYIPQGDGIIRVRCEAGTLNEIGGNDL